MSRIAIAGGGIAGLSLAHALMRRGTRERGVEVVVLERAARPGGNLRSERVGGYVCEHGPNGFLDSVPETLELVRDLGLEPRLQPSDASASRRFVWRSGRLHALPGGPGAFLASGLLSWRGKLRIAAEPFARRRPEGVDETIHAFAARRIGREAADVLIDAMVSGVFAGDARRLSLRACFPKMWQMETDHGGLFRALIARGRARRRGAPVGAPAGRLTSFRGGIEELIAALADRLGPIVRTGCGVRRVSRTGAGYRLELDGAEAIEADAVALASPAGVSARLVSELDAELSRQLAAIPSAPVAVVALGFEASRLPRPLDGFGFLVPRGEEPRVLGVLWDSSIFPGRAPEGRVLMRAMVGGAHDPEGAALPDDALLECVRTDLRTTMGIEALPELARIVRHPVGIPQYAVGHRDRLDAIETRLRHLPGLHVAGNGYRGVAINACAADAGPLAERVLASVGAAEGVRARPA